MSTKKKSDKEANSDALRKMREKQAVAKSSSAKQVKGKKSPAPAKKAPAKQQPVEKVAKKGKAAESPTSDQEFMSQSTLLGLKEDAARIDAEIDQGIAALDSAVSGLKSKHALVEDFIDRELWRYTPTPYKSETAWKRDKEARLGSASMLFNIASGFKALKGHTTQKQREEMGPRKRAVVTSAVKKAKEKGRPVPIEIIEKAADPKTTEPELRKAVVEANLAPDPEPSKDDRQSSFDVVADPLLAKPTVNTFPESPRKGGSGVVEGQTGAASQFDSAVNDAIECASVIYCDGEPERDFSVNLRFVCNLWLGQACEAAGHEKQTNAEALAEWRRKHKGCGSWSITNIVHYEPRDHKASDV